MTALEEWNIRVKQYLDAGIGIIDAFDMVHSDAPGVWLQARAEAYRPPAGGLAKATARPLRYPHTRAKGTGEAPALTVGAQGGLHLALEGLPRAQRCTTATSSSLIW
jgi:hypothetical protein